MNSPDVIHRKYFFLNLENLVIIDPHLVTPRFSNESRMIKVLFCCEELINDPSWLIILSLWSTQHISWDCRCCCAESGLLLTLSTTAAPRHGPVGWLVRLAWGLPGHHEQVSKPRALLGITSPSHNQPWPTSSQSVRKQENDANTLALVTPKYKFKFESIWFRYLNAPSH